MVWIETIRVIGAKVLSKSMPLLGFDGLGLLNGQFLSSTGSLVFSKQADLCQVRCALDNKFLRVNGFTILPEDNLMSL